MDETPSVLYKLTSQKLLRYSSWYPLELLLYRTWADHLHTSWTYWTSRNQQRGRLVGFFGIEGVERGRIASWPLKESKIFEFFSYRWQVILGLTRNLIGSIATWRTGTSTWVKYSLGTNVNTPLCECHTPQFEDGAGARVETLYVHGRYYTTIQRVALSVPASLGNHLTIRLLKAGFH